MTDPTPPAPSEAEVEAAAAGYFYGRQAELTELYGADSPFAKRNTTWELCDQTSKDAYLKDARWMLTAAYAVRDDALTDKETHE